jgi:Asp-tRNA(Asn)/Glu-tRNA(Gln) amidotransferase C subunit
MEISKDDVRNLAKIIDLEIPEADLNTVALRLSGLLALMDEVEKDLGDEMDEIDPIPPVYPREEF